MSKLAFAKAWLLKRPLAVGLSTIAVGVVLFAVVRTLGHSWTPVFDDGQIWMHTWDVGTRHTPLIGPPSRLGWHHPGPLLYYLLAPLLRLFGGLPSALLVGVFLLGLASAITLVVLAARTAGTGAALVLALGTALVSLGHGDRLTDPWNPHLVVLPFALFVVSAWLACCGNAVAGLLAVTAGTLAAQSHLGALPPVLIIGASAAAMAVFVPFRSPERTRSKRLLALTLASPFILWAPPVVEQLRASGGNMTLIVRFFQQPGEPVLGWTKGLLVAGYELLPWGPWLGRERPTLLGELPLGEWWELAVSCSPLLVALLLALRFRDPLGIRLVVVGVAAVIGCVVANAQTRGMPLAYLTLWSRSIAMLLVSAPFIVLARKYATPIVPWLRSGVAQLAGIAIVSVTIGIRVAFADVPVPVYNRIYPRIVRSAIDAFPPGTTVRVAPVGQPFSASAEAIVIGLERADRTGKMLAQHAYQLGEHHTVPDHAIVPTLMLCFGGAIEHRPKPGIGWVVDQYDPLSPQQRKEAVMLREKIEQGLRAAGRDDLVQPLHEGAAWIWLSMPSTVDSTELGRYLALASGIDKFPWALYALPPAAW